MTNQPKPEVTKWCHYHRGPFQDECPLGGKCELLEDWHPAKPEVKGIEQFRQVERYKPYQDVDVDTVAASELDALLAFADEQDKNALAYCIRAHAAEAKVEEQGKEIESLKLDVDLKVSIARTAIANFEAEEKRVEAEESRLKAMEEELSAAKADELEQSGILWKRYSASPDCAKFTFSGWLNWKVNRAEAMEEAVEAAQCLAEDHLDRVNEQCFCLRCSSEGAALVATIVHEDLCPVGIVLGNTK